MIPKVTKETFDEVMQRDIDFDYGLELARFENDQSEIPVEKIDSRFVAAFVTYHALLIAQEEKQKQFIGYSEDGQEVWY